MAGFDPSPIRRLVELICTDPDLLLQTEDGRIVRPVQPVAFESLPHAEKVCQAAVKVVEVVADVVAVAADVAAAAGVGAPFNVSLCDVTVVCVDLTASIFAAV